MTGTNQQKTVAIWLLLCCTIILAMMVLGAVTRLTGSGLSMVQWQPVMGILPPFSQMEWEETFFLYQQFPEYKIKNLHMSLGEFKSIFWLEYAHRLLGRLIGMIFLIPFLYFFFRGRLDKPLIPKLIIIFVLGGLQGVLGWYMVKSGLANDPHVSQYRLTAHLGLAVIVYAYIFWVAVDLLAPERAHPATKTDRKLARFSLLITVLIFITVLSGGFVAGTRAGFTFNTFPLMAGRLYPEGMLVVEPMWKNLFENIATIQFNHRLLATVLFLTIPAFWWSAQKTRLSPGIRTGFHLLLTALAVQLTLGISTLLLAVPVPLAAAHQAGAIVLLTISLYLSNRIAKINL